MLRSEGMAPIVDRRQGEKEEVRRGQDPIDDSLLRPRFHIQRRQDRDVIINNARRFSKDNRDDDGGDNGDDKDDDDDDKNNGKNNNSDGDGDKTNPSSFTLLAPPPPPPPHPPPPPPPPPTVIISAEPSTVTMTMAPSTVIVISTMSASSVAHLSTISPAAVAPIPEIVNNPQVSVSPLMTSFVPLMTTTPVASSHVSQPASDTPTSSAIPTSTTTTESSFSASASPTTTSLPFAFQDNTPSPTYSIINVGGNGDMDADGDRGMHGKGPPGGLNPTTEDVLISLGSIGGFILVCFVVWVVWRAMRKSKAKKNSMYDNRDPSGPNQLLGRIPFFNRAQGGWHNLGESGSMDLRGAPPSYEKAIPMSPPSQGYYNVDKTNMPRMSAQGVQPQQNLQNVLPQIQTNFAGSNTYNPTSASPVGITLSPTSSNQINGTLRSIATVNTVATTGTAGTNRSLMPDPYFNQSELARQPSDAYNPTQRQVYRASELSSISSGFGDGDIIMMPPTASQPLRDPNNMVGRFSWQTRKSMAASEAGGNRDTVYTQSSEDMPPRFRTVDSWVNQQSGRVQRAEQRADAPPVPALPPAERFTMMLDDEQAPRRPGT